MAMNWLKGLVAPPAQFPGQQPQQGMPPADGPPVGGVPQSPYGAAPGMAPGAPPQQAPMGAPYDASGSLPNPMVWSTGTKTQGGGGQPISGGVAGAGASAGAAPGGAPRSVEARLAQLQHDVDSLALFSRTLLTMLEESKTVTREQFDATKNRLDMLDGKLDDK